jgi:hypothetical protein
MTDLSPDLQLIWMLVVFEVSAFHEYCYLKLMG